MTALELAAANEAEADGLQGRVTGSLQEEVQDIAEFAKALPARLVEGLDDRRRRLVSPVIEKAVALSLQLIEARMRHIASIESRAATLREQAKMLREMAATEPAPPADPAPEAATSST